MVRFTAPADADQLQDLAADLRLPVLLADQQIHRRVAAHFVWMPTAQSPHILRTIPEVISAIAGAAHPGAAIILGEAAQHLAYQVLVFDPQPGEPRHG